MKNNIDLLLIQAPSSNPYSKSSYTIPLGIAYLAAFARDAGYSVELIDMCVSELNRDDFYLFLEKINPKVIGFTTTVFTYDNAIRIAEFTKKNNPHIPIIFGGCHISFLPEVLKEFRFIDVIVRGEGEITLIQLLDFYIKKNIDSLFHINGISFIHKDKLINTKEREFIKEIDKLPFPARDLFNIKEYKKPFTILTGRGCPFRCTFCTNGVMWKSQYRKRNVRNVVDEIEIMAKEYQADYISILDDTFLYNDEQVMEFCNALEEKNISIKWSCTARGSEIREDVLRRIFNLGCVGIVVGVESGNDITLKKIKKNVTIEMIKKTVTQIARNGIIPSCSFILGFPWENHEEYKKTLDFAKELIKIGKMEGVGVQIEFGVLAPLPGTELYQDFIEEINNIDWRCVNFLEPIIENQSMKKREIQNYLCEAFLLDQESKIVRTKGDEA